MAGREMRALFAAVMAAIQGQTALSQDSAAAVAAVKAGNLAEALRIYMVALDNLPSPPPRRQETMIKEAIVRVAKRMTPPPGVPDEVAMATERGRTYIRVAKDSTDFFAAEREFARAVRLAPWVPGSLLNLAIVEEKLGRYIHAYRNLRLFRLAAPNDPQAATALTKMAELQVLATKAAQGVPWQKREVGKWKVQERALEGFPEVILESDSKYIPLIARCSVQSGVEAFINWSTSVGDHPVVTYRIGSAPEIKENWSGSSAGTSSFAPDPKHFLEVLTAADKLEAQVNETSGKQIKARFNTSRLADALRPLRAACEWPAEQKGD